CVIFDYNTELAKLLIESGADINAKDKDGNTALDYARYRDNSEIEQLLIEKGAKQ
ncbi:ankyrin repeat domain-containing protein, partial [Brachyspira pulli]|uniref:ankyrin repeat domain-containing protein n=1 Tax=Brachyspira pulli TaxID=310721 RepID=UPI0030055C75